MQQEDFDQDWEAASKEMLTAMKVWRQEHPRATWVEMEQELDRRLRQLRGEMLEDLAHASVLADLRALAPAARPVCAHCGGALGPRGQETRTLYTDGDHRITLTRSYAVCPHCQVGFFPLDAELGLLPGHLTPTLQEHTTRLGAWIPFAKVGVLLKDLLGVEISPATTRRCVEQHGRSYEAVQTAAVVEIETQLPEPPAGPAKQLLSVDGAMVPLVHGQWVEVKTLVVGEIQDAVQQQGEWVVQSTAHSYFSRLADAETFQRLALVETQRRGVETAAEVVAPTDGAVWIEGFLAYHRPDAHHILDFGHAAEHVAVIGRVQAAPDSAAFQAWLTTRLHTLKHDGATALLPELRQCVAAHPEQTEAANALAYLEKRVAQMDYPAYQRAGWPIGSGSVESANKVVVEARLKGAGMHWADTNVNSMLSLRNAVCSDRWAEAWQEITTQQHQQRQQRYCERAKQRTLVPPPPPLPPRPAPAPRNTESRSATPKEPWRPPADHPWRRSLDPPSRRRSRSAEI